MSTTSAEEIFGVKLRTSTSVAWRGALRELEGGREGGVARG